MAMYYWKLQDLVKSGDRFSYSEYNLVLISDVSEDGFSFYDDSNGSIDGYSEYQEWDKFSFFRDDVKLDVSEAI